MLDIKWKNNKKSIWTAVITVLIITIAYMAMYPAFERMAAVKYENPLTGESTILSLYESNYVQYRYLRERVDQKKYSYPDLYYRVTKMETTDKEDLAVARAANTVDYYEDDLDKALGEYQDRVSRKLDNWEANANELLSLMEYYAEDTETGISMTNSSNEALAQLAKGEEPEQDSYSYYVKMEYDSIGNVVNCAVRTEQNAGDFLKNVQVMGRTSFLTPDDGKDGIVWIQTLDDSDEVNESYEIRYGKPSNMIIVYALTRQQYQNLLTNKDFSWFSHQNLWYESYYSYIRAGVNMFVILYILLAAAAGMFLPVIRQKKGYNFHFLKICRLPAEVYWLGILIAFLFTDSMVEILCNYQIYGGFFTYGFGIPFLFFAAVFILGSGMYDMIHFRTYVRKRSILYRYWDKIFNYIKQFYTELVEFDIGSNAQKIIVKLVICNFILLAFLCTMWFFGIFGLVVYSVVLYFLLKKYVKDIQNKYRNLLHATSAIAKGNLDNALSEDFGVFESYKSELRQIQTDFKKAVDEEVKSQRMKSELITNVSHDLKTPLTAIITYIDLLKEPNITDEQREEYIRTLDKKALRLKVLIEDLFEVSKANSKSVTLHMTDMDICSLVRQVYLEHEDQAEKLGLDFRFQMPDHKVTVSLDSQKAYRVFENLYVNIAKYAMENTRVYVTITEAEDSVNVVIKNISRMELDIAPEELTERFVRGDGSRNTEGSGLGLAIAKSFTELQNGTMDIQIDGDLFKVSLTFPKVKAER